MTIHVAIQRAVKLKTIRSSWWEGHGYRLDCQPYTGGALEAKILLESLPGRKDLIRDLTTGEGGGIYYAGRDKINWVNSEEFGIPCLGSADIIKADLSNLPLISKEQVIRNPLLLVHQGWTLITRSGTIGRLAYVRTEMDGMACQDVLRVVPDPKKILPGYLYAFLSSRFGVPLVASGTYGAIIQHIEPEHIADIPIPRFKFDFENAIHDMIEEASRLRTRANAILKQCRRTVDQRLGIDNKVWKYSKDNSFAFGSASISPTGYRLDAFHYVGYIREGYESLGNKYALLGDVADVLRPDLMKRDKVSEGGTEFLGGADLQTVMQSTDQRIANTTRHLRQYIVRKGTVLFQCVGQRYGIFGRPFLANRTLAGKGVTEAVMRVIPRDPGDAGYMTAYFATDVGRRSILAFSAGSSIPVLQEVGAKNIRIFWPEKEFRHGISLEVAKAYEMRAMAVDLDRKAGALLEGQMNAIREA